MSIPDVGYLIRRLDPFRIEVSKWSWSNEPDAVYVMIVTRRGDFTCSCPTKGKRMCKHVSLVKRFLKTEHTRDPYKMVFDEGE